MTVLLPNLWTAHPANGSASIEPIGNPRSSVPNCASDRLNFICISGSLAAQEAKQRPAIKNKLPRATLLFCNKVIG